MRAPVRILRSDIEDEDRGWEVSDAWCDIKIKRGLGFVIVVDGFGMIPEPRERACLEWLILWKTPVTAAFLSLQARDIVFSDAIITVGETPKKAAE